MRTLICSPAWAALPAALMLAAILAGCGEQGIEEGDHPGISPLNGSWSAGAFALTGPEGRTVSFNTVFMGITMNTDSSGTANLASNAAPHPTPGAYSGTVTAKSGGVHVTMTSGEHALQFNLHINSDGTQLQGTATYTAPDGSQYTGTVTFNKVDTH